MIETFFNNWASEASPTLGCSIEISRDIYIYMLSVCRMSYDLSITSGGFQFSIILTTYSVYVI